MKNIQIKEGNVLLAFNHKDILFTGTISLDSVNKDIEQFRQEMKDLFVNAKHDIFIQVCEHEYHNDNGSIRCKKCLRLKDSIDFKKIK